MVVSGLGTRNTRNILVYSIACTAFSGRNKVGTGRNFREEKAKGVPTYSDRRNRVGTRQVHDKKAVFRVFRVFRPEKWHAPISPVSPVVPLLEFRGRFLNRLTRSARRICPTWKLRTAAKRKRQKKTEKSKHCVARPSAGRSGRCWPDPDHAANARAGGD